MSTPTAPIVQVKKSARPAPAPQPGALRNQARLEIQTRQAQFLLDGRTGPRGIIGLLQFARRLGDICQAAQQDDPHADWMLLRVDESIAAAKAFIQEKNICQSPSKSFHLSTSNFFQFQGSIRGSDWPFCSA